MEKNMEKNGEKFGKIFPFFSGKFTQKSFIPDVTDGPVTHFFAKLDDTPGENPFFDSGRSTGQRTHYASGFDIEQQEIDLPELSRSGDGRASFS